MAYGTSLLVRGALILEESGQLIDQVRFQYNPDIVTESRAVDYALSGTPGQVMPTAVFQKIDPTRWRFRLLLFDREGQGDTERDLARLRMFVLPGPRFGEGTTQYVAPSAQRLVLGSRHVKGRVKTLNIVQEIFDRRLNVRVARIDIEFFETSGGPEADLTSIGYERMVAAGLL